MELNKKRNETGFGLVETLVATGIVAIIAVGVGSLITSTLKQRSTVITDSNIDLLREVVLRNLQNDEAFVKTLRNATNAAVFDCINKSTDCRIAGGEFKIYDKNDSPLSLSSMSTETSSGFTSEGISCSGFNAAAGSDTCPFKYVATWAPECYQSQNIQGKASIETACRDPLIKISVVFTSKFVNQNKFPIINSSKMKISIIKSQNDVALADQGNSALKNMCEQMSGGVFNTVSSTCILPTANPTSCAGTCGANRNSFVTGFNTDGSPKCGCAVAALTTCTPNGGAVGSVLTAVASNGTISCGDGIVPVLISTGAINNPPIIYGGDGGS